MTWISDRRIYLTADDRVVEEGDPAATTLLVGVGGQLSDVDAKRYGLSESRTAGEKQKQAPAENKARQPRENK